MIARGLIYFGWVFLCTAFLNVPLNNAVAAVNPASGDAATVWERYLKDWTLWNHVRTTSSTAATAPLHRIDRGQMTAGLHRNEAPCQLISEIWCGSATKPPLNEYQFRDRRSVLSLQGDRYQGGEILK